MTVYIHDRDIPIFKIVVKLFDTVLMDIDAGRIDDVILKRVEHLATEELGRMPHEELYTKLRIEFDLMLLQQEPEGSALVRQLYDVERHAKKRKAAERVLKSF